MNEELKQNYIILRNNMYNIRQNIDNTIELYNELLANLKNGILTDNEIIYNNEFNKNLKSLKNVRNEVTTEVLVSINNKI